ncbi:zinc finger, RING/FYVE/PHD-type [Artemisia annua]|uniref:RING-type E3 ubiquitin transferase n=1 Tax=Artemisia annua TaxID=35608 RepID=A0A2U1L5U1_ARTAN|nr:zinc finger, RING/FYVE/PHD-type [Artemisia annua]
MVDINLPKALTQSLPSPPPPRFQSSHSKSNMPMLYYGLVVVATAAIVLAIYNLIIVRWCANQYRRSRDANQHFASHRRPSTSRNNMSSSLTPSTLSRGGSAIGLTSSFRYKKGVEDANNDKAQMDNDIECSVCLSVFEEGEEVRKLPRCNHSFHASCIDMWLYSHFDCPLCRAPVVDTSETPPQHRHTDSEHSRDNLLVSSSV